MKVTSRDQSLAGGELPFHSPLRILIVDPDLDSRSQLKTVLEAEPAIKIVGEHAEDAGAIDAILAEQPDLVFLQLSNPEVDRFEIMETIQAQADVLFILVANSDQYALRAIEVRAFDYLVQPVNAARLQESLALARAQVSRTRRETPVEGPPSASSEASGTKYLQRLSVRAGGRVLFFKVEDIDWFEADVGYVILQVGKECYLVSESL